MKLLSVMFGVYTLGITVGCSAAPQTIPDRDPAQSERGAPNTPLANATSKDAGAEFVSPCGVVNYVNVVDFKDVLRDSNNPLSPTNPVVFSENSVIKNWSPRVVQLQWDTARQIRSKRYEGYRVRAGDFGGERTCSGSVIDVEQRLILTAAHCVRPSEKDGERTPYLRAAETRELTDRVLPANAIARYLNANFYFEGRDLNEATKKEVSFKVEELVEYGFERSGKLDYAVLRLEKTDEVMSELRKVGSFKFNSKNVTDGSKVLLIQHPNGEPKKVMSGDTVGAPNGRPLRWIYYYNLDTDRGSSGSPVLNPDGEIVGVHIKAGCSKVGLNKKWANAAETMSEIVKVSKTVKDRNVAE